ncbi:MAG: phenylalanine--tRNA ligase subunit beta [Candidatus Magasanikbacteria bacterium]|nr:phenylalanine--tRNA ligase subunit beta [Candidatus Magasanikbacteria bacterium]
MIISKHWLRDFVFLPDALDAPDLARRLSLAVAEVEGVTEQARSFDNLVVGKILKVEAHPNADKLKVCTVDIGESEVTIVCGGSNVIEGMKVIVGLIGAKVKWHGEGELVELALVKIRGVESSGMICASDEVGLLDRFPKQVDNEIVDLSELKDRPGTPIATALGLDDVLFEFDNKSLTNRPDLWGHYGMAREIAALTKKKFTPLKVAKIKEGKSVALNIKVVAPSVCPRYQALVLTGVQATESPAWLKKHLLAVGQKPINAIVDLTNYVMFELGQPLHAFDVALLSTTGADIVLEIRQALSGEKFVSLEEKELVLPADAVVIANNGTPIALAGIKGGKNSEVSATTQTIVLESANFAASSVRQTSTALNLRTEASARFEKTLDPQLTELALARFVELAKKVWPKSSVASGVVDVRNGNDKPLVLEFPVKLISDRLGVEISDKTTQDILERLGFEIKIKKGQLHAVVPTWRASKDIRIPEDVIEEIARLYGYENIPGVLPTCPINPPVVNSLRQLEREIKEVLAFECGFTEVANYSFVAPEWLASLGVLKGADYLELDNPIAKDRPLLRRELIPGLIENVRAHGHTEGVSFFEIGRVFLPDEAGERAGSGNTELLPAQPLKLGLVYTNKENKEPFYQIADAVRAIGNELGYEFSFQSETESKALYHPGRLALIKCGLEVVGQIAELHPAKQAELGILSRVAIAEVSLTKLVDVVAQKITYQMVSEFPEVERDLAFTVKKSITHQEIIQAIEATHELVKKVSVFDMYQSKDLGPDIKSLAYHVILGANRTLTAEEIDGAVKKIQKKLTEKFGAEWRS